MELYALYLPVLGLSALVVSQWRSRFQTRPALDDLQRLNPSNETLGNAGLGSDAKAFRKLYFVAYTLVLAADWLQGPYIYSIYREDHGLSEHSIAMLFGTGFVTAGLTASFAGALADRYGRRNACFVYCAVTALSCMLLLVQQNLPLLFLGRALGGLSSTLLYTVFETWMVEEFSARGLSTTMRLSDMFSWSASLSGIVAIAAGSVGEGLVQVTGAHSSPFMVAVACLVCAESYIRGQWSENYGNPQKVEPADEEKPVLASNASEGEPRVPWKQLVPLFAATTAFEGSMYLFVFLWTPALTAARHARGSADPLPLGLIFSCFMCAMVTGSSAFSLLNASTNIKSWSLMLSQTLAVAACALLTPVLLKGESLVFWSFACFEVCVGMYYPLMAKLKSELIENSIRAKVYAWMRLPLNFFVFVTLTVTRDWDNHRNDVLAMCGTLLIAASYVVQRWPLRPRQGTT